MAVNLLDSVKDALASQVAEKIGSAVGLDKQQTSTALKIVVPILIGVIMKKMSSPAGASELGKVLKDTDTSILDNLAGKLGGGSSGPDFMSLGGKLMPMLFGSDRENVVASLVKLLGLNDKSVGNLIALVLPIVMAVIGKQAKNSGGFDIGALTNLLGEQKSFLSSAIPSDLQGAFGLASSLASSAAQPDQNAGSTNPLQWLLPLIAIAVLGYLGYNYLFKNQEVNKPTPPTGPASVSGNSVDAAILPESPALPDVSALQNKLQPVFEGLNNTLEAVKDLESANSSLDKIKESVEAFKQLGLDTQSPAVKAALIPFLGKALARLQREWERLSAIPGLKELIEPIIEPMLRNMQSLAG